MTTEKRTEYNKRYYQKHKEELAEKHKIWTQNSREHIKEYYRKNKDKIYEGQKEYIKRNRKKITKMMIDYRKRKGEELKKQGQMFYYLPKTERQNRMVKYLCRKSGMTEERSRTLLEERNWNIKSILYDLAINNLD